MKTPQTRRFPVSRQGGRKRADPDRVAVEEPLEIRVRTGGTKKAATIGVTMRTPGGDRELAVGLLFSEGVVRRRGDVAEVACGPADSDPGGVVTVQLADEVDFDAGRLSRHLLTGSACGVCGRTTLDMLWQAGVRPFAERLRPDPAVLEILPDRMRAAQTLFDMTGGTHAAALFDLAGTLLEIREDVGRHNAVDKVVGRLLMSNRIPAPAGILAVSGRASYELVQKSLAAGIPCLAAVGAPSSLAVELAAEFRMTLVGFLGARGGNVYSG